MEMDEYAVAVPQPGLIWIFVHATLIVNTFISCQTQDIVFTQTEESQPGTYVGEVLGKTNLASKYHDSILKTLRFNFLSASEPGVNFFRINPVRGEIYTSSIIDRDTLCEVVNTCCFAPDGCYINLIVGVSPQDYFSIFNVRINILDVNDNNPIFPESSFTIKIPESSPINSTFLIPIASDVDSGRNCIQKYTIQSPLNTFGIKEIKADNEITDVAIINLMKLDRETQPLYGVKVFAVDGGQPPKTGTLAVNIEITDTNDNQPVFRNSGYTVSIRENTAVNSSIIQIKADDPDFGINGQIRYAISRRASPKVKSTFSIDPETGWIHVRQPLNYEGTKIYHIPVEAQDLGPRSLPRRTMVSVHVIDVNDNSPTIHVNTLSKKNKAEVKESDSSGEIVAHILIQDIDTGQNGKVSCSVDNSYFLLIKDSNISNQDVYRLITAAPLNRETTPEYQVTIVCQDMGEPKLETRETFTVSLLDVNDNNPVFTKKTYTASTEENNNLGVFLLQVHADDQDDGLDGTVKYEVSADGKGLVTINQEGKVYASTVFDREQYDEIMFHVLAVDGGESPLSATATIVLRIIDQNDNSPYFLDDYTFNVSENAEPNIAVGKVEARDLDTDKNREVDFSLEDDQASKYFAVTRKGVVVTRRRLDREHKPVYTLNVVATDRGLPPQSTTSQVKVKITDKNDNKPSIRFPTPSNNTVYISYLTHMAQAFTKVDAVDADSGKNAELLYYIIHGNKDRFFSVDEHTGVMIINKPLRIEDADDYKLTIEVRDKGHPFHSKTSTLTIVIDGTGKPITISGAYIENKPNNKNLIIVICLASVSGVLAIVLIIAIVCIRKKDMQNHNYNVKTETQRIFNNKRTSPTHSRNSNEDRKSPSPTHKKEVSFSMDNDDFVENNHSTFKAPRMQNWGPNMATTYEPTRTCRSLTQDTTSERRLTYDRNPLTPSKNCDNQHPQPKLKPLVDLQQEACDTGSDTSTNQSTTDSGRGGSIDHVTLPQKTSAMLQDILDHPRQHSGDLVHCDQDNQLFNENNNRYSSESDVNKADTSSGSVDPELLCIEIDNLFFTDV